MTRINRGVVGGSAKQRLGFLDMRLCLFGHAIAPARAKSSPWSASGLPYGVQEIPKLGRKYSVYRWGSLWAQPERCAKK